MIVTEKENGMVEVQSLSGDIVELDQGSYKLAKGLMQLAERTSPKILRAAAARLAADPEPSKESSFLLRFIDQYLVYSHLKDSIA